LEKLGAGGHQFWSISERETRKKDRWGTEVGKERGFGFVSIRGREKTSVKVGLSSFPDRKFFWIGGPEIQIC